MVNEIRNDQTNDTGIHVGFRRPYVRILEGKLKLRVCYPLYALPEKRNP
jgi:hypothetical protein